MSITKYVDEKLIVSLVIASAIIFFMQKYFTKKFTHPDGSVSHYVGAGKTWV